MTEGATANVPAPLRWQRATLQSVVSRTSRAKSFFLVPAAPFVFRAGQHVDVRLTADDGYRVQRSYSIASEPEAAGAIELTIDRFDEGEVSPYFHDVVAPGDTVELRGPIGGHFVWSVEDGGPLLLLGGGSGVVPLRSMLRHHVACGSEVPVLLLVSAPTWGDVLFRDELLAASEGASRVSVVLALTREPARRAQDFGRRVDASMLRELSSRWGHAPRRCFVCGSNRFAEAASDALLAAGVPAESIRTERYGG